MGACLGGVAVSAAAPPRAALRGLVCRRAADPPARAMNITAVMRPLEGTRHMSVRFQLLQRAPGNRVWNQIGGAGLGDWVPTSDPTLGQRRGDVWIVHHPVADLAGPAFYRYRVTFRWTGAGAKVIGVATRTSHSCWQPEPRPDLLVQSITVAAVPNHPKLDEYTAVISNEGATPAGPFAVQLVDGSVVKQQTISRLGRHISKTLHFYGPLCRTSAPPKIVVDPAGAVDDYNRANNSLTTACS